MFGRAPVIHDLHIAVTIWGFVDPAPPAELVALRRPLFEGAAEPEHYDDRCAQIVDMVPDATLGMTPAEVQAAYPERWRDLVGTLAVADATDRSAGDGVGAQVGEVDELQRRHVRRLEHHRAGGAGVERLRPAGGAHAPLVAGPQAGEPVLRHRRARSLPRSAENTRNSAVTRQHTTCRPGSSPRFSQHPERW